MSEENIEIVHRAEDAWNRQDIEGILALTDPEAEYVNASKQLSPGPGEARRRSRVVENPVGEPPRCRLGD